MATPTETIYSVDSGGVCYGGNFAPIAWWEGMEVGEWREIPGTSSILLTPTNEVRQTDGVPNVQGPISRLKAWCGLSINTKTGTIWSAANGGHGDYFGNEVIALSLLTNSPAWREVHPGSSGYVADVITTAADRSHALYLDDDGAAPWTASTAYSTFRRVQNGGNVYHLVTPGVSAASVGPTGTGGSITDGSCVWTYVGSAAVVAPGVPGTGLPASAHSYYGQQFIEKHKRAIRLGGSTSPIGSAFENVEAFDIEALSWDGYNANTQAPPYGYCVGSGNNGWTPSIGWAACKHPETEMVYVVTQTVLRGMTPHPTIPGSGTWADLAFTPWSPNPFTGAYGAMSVDTNNGFVCWFMGNGQQDISIWIIDFYGSKSQFNFPSSAAATAMKSAAALDGGAANKPGSSGVVFIPQLNAHLVRQGAAGGLIYKIDGSTFVVSVVPTTGGEDIPAAHPFVDQQGIYNRWLYVPNLKGVVYFPKADENGWFYRAY